MCVFNANDSRNRTQTAPDAARYAHGNRPQTARLQGTLRPIIPSSVVCTVFKTSVAKRSIVVRRDEGDYNVISP